MIKTHNSVSRRVLLAGGAALSATALFGQKALAVSGLTVGFIYVGAKDDYAYNQAHAEGAAAVRARPGVRVLEEETWRKPRMWRAPCSR